MNKEEEIKRDCCIYETLEDVLKATPTEIDKALISAEFGQRCGSSSGTKAYDDAVRKHRRDADMELWYGAKDLTDVKQTDTQEVKESIAKLKVKLPLARLWGNMKHRIKHICNKYL